MGSCKYQLMANSSFRNQTETAVLVSKLLSNGSLHDDVTTFRLVSSTRSTH